MECLGRFTALSLLVGLASCRLAVQELEVGQPWTQHQVQELAVEEDGRQEVLDVLGPPEELFYTLDHEIFEYRFGSHRGTDLEFFTPSDSLQTPFGVGFVGALVRVLSPFRQPEEFEDPHPVVSATGGAVGGVDPASGAEVLGLMNRKVRYDVLRITLDRKSERIVDVESRMETSEGSASSLWKSVILMDDEPPKDSTGD